MNFGTADLLARLVELEASAGKPGRYLIAFSGGLDSTVLLHAAAATRAQHGRDVVAVHVDHQLHPESSRWSEHCGAIAARLRVEFVSETVDVDRAAGLGPEAAAREARYAALNARVGQGEWLLSAHHRDDQAETLLLNLLRGSGPAGVAAIPALRRFGRGWLVRPLLAVSRQALAHYAENLALEWIEDPGNDESAYDRNFLRNELMPLLRRRWPDASQRLAASAALAREASDLLAEFADADIALTGGEASRLDIASLVRFSAPRQRNLLRRAIALSGLPPAPAEQLRCVIEELVPAREDAVPLVEWQDAEARRFQGRVYLLPTLPEIEFAGQELGDEPVDLGPGMGSLELVRGSGPGLAEDCIRAGLRLARRQGGEKIKPIGHRHTRKLKKLLHESGVLPWMRDRLPLVYSGERLVAVADLWIDASAAAAEGSTLRWRGRPQLD